MANNHDRLNKIIDLAMEKHRARGNANLSDEATAEIRTKWCTDDINEKIAAGWDDDRFAERLANAVGRAQRARPSDEPGVIGGLQMRAALADAGQGEDKGW